MHENNTYADGAIESLAIIKDDIKDNQFDVRLLEVVDVDGEVLETSAHQDWEVVASSSTRNLSGRQKVEINCINDTDYKAKINRLLSEVNEILPNKLLEIFTNSQAFLYHANFEIDKTSIGYTDTCGNCGGSGKVSCSSCGGSGVKHERVHVRDNITYSTDSHGNRRELSRTPVYEERSYKCVNCSGTGRVVCNPCSGTGLITRVTDITRCANLHQTYSIQNGKYSDKTIAEIMQMPMQLLKDMSIWSIGQSTAQGNHFQIQYTTLFWVIYFNTLIEQTKFSFMAFYDAEIKIQHVFDKSPILDTILHKPLDLASQALSNKRNTDYGFQLLAEFDNYSFLSEIMTKLLATTNYAVKNVKLLVNKASKGYMSEDKQQIMSKSITHVFKSCVPTYSKKALILSSLWLLFTYEVLALPFLPLGRSISTIDWFIVAGIMVLISGFGGAFISKNIVDKKHRKLPENIIAPKTKHFKMAFRFAGVFALLGYLTIAIGLHDAVFEKFFGGNIEDKFYNPAKIVKQSTSSTQSVNKKNASQSNNKHKR